LLGASIKNHHLKFKLYIGIDWANDKHDLSTQLPDGTVFFIAAGKQKKL
jgi:hypothetical protein